MNRAKAHELSFGHELRYRALRTQAIQFMERVAREFMKSLISIHDTECQIIIQNAANIPMAKAS